MNRKGFTLVEVLIVVTILGIIMGLSVPLIRNIQKKNENKKFGVYGKSLVSSAKLYTDSYGIDMFGESNYGCNEISYHDLSKKVLLKDIEGVNASCDDDETLVRVIKLNDKYTYETKITCKNENGKKVYTENNIKSVNLDCSGGALSEGPQIFITPLRDPEKREANSTKNKNVKVRVYSDYGIYRDSSFYYAWSTDSEGTNLVTQWKKQAIGNEGIDKIEYEKIFTLKTNNLPTGDYYLIVRLTDNNGEITLKDGAGNHNKNDKFIGGPYVVDKEAPNISNATIRSKHSWNSFDVAYVGSGVTDNVNKSDLRVCLSQSKDGCNNDTQFVLANKATLKLKNLSYKGQSVKVYIFVRDLSKNLATKSIDYKLYKECETVNLVSTTLKEKGTCNKKCDGGVRTDIYNAKDKNSQNACSGKTVLVPNVKCNEIACCSDTSVKNVEVVKDWGACSKACGTGKTTRTVKDNYYSDIDTNVFCESKNRTETKECNKQSCCSSTSGTPDPWGSWSTCSKTCGTGTQSRSRTVKYYSNYDGSLCDTRTETVSQNCNQHGCCSSTKESGNWWDVTGCSAVCGAGTKTQRINLVSAYDGKTSCGTKDRTVACDAGNCCRSVKESGNWWNVTSCSASCGGGTLTQRINLVSALDGKTSCGTRDRTVACGTSPCSPQIDCWRSGSNGYYEVRNGVATHWYYYQLVGFKSGYGNWSSSNPFETGYGRITQHGDTWWVYERYSWGQQYGQGISRSGHVSNVCYIG